ncbi:LGFP repeat-containing protein [Spirosoma arcticum]
MSTLQFDMEKLGQALTKWDKKGGSAAEYKSAGSNYRTYKPTVSPTPQGGLFVSTKLDHIRGGAADDHAQLEMEFAANGVIVSTRATMKIQGHSTLDTGLIKEAAAIGGTAAGGPGYGAAASAIGELSAKIINSLSKFISDISEHGGRANFPAVVQMNMNYIFDSLILPPEKPSVIGDIRVKWLVLGGASSFLGEPLTVELGTPDGVGRYNHFQGGSIYWTPTLGAHEVHGYIRAKWELLGWERSFLGYPVTDETVTPDGVGRYNHFQGGSIYWTPTLGAHEVHGAIRDKWASMGWERSSLGYPISDEIDAIGGLRISKFEHGYITWSISAGAIANH